MRTAVEVHIPILPPSANNLWRRSGTRIHKSSRYAKWLIDAGFIVMAQRAGSITGPYKMTINAVRPDKRRRDLDNLAKGTCDLLKSVGVIEDDSLCEMLNMRWVTQGDGMTVRVERAGIE